MDFGFETIGNATLICHDSVPVLITDPWITGSAYFGSWTFSHDIPEEQLQSIQRAQYAWISHGHPDHLNRDSLPHLRDKIILLPDHVRGRIAADLKEEGYRVQSCGSKFGTSSLTASVFSVSQISFKTQFC